MEVIARSIKHLQVELQAGTHRLIADEPATDGGNDSGMEPFELLLSALGSCTVMTVQLYAQRKGWPLESVEIKLNHHTILGKECLDCVSGPDAKVEVIEKEIKFGGPLSEEQTNRLMQIADKCPVHRALLGEIKIVSQVTSTAVS
jgi:putative redox protein